MVASSENYDTDDTRSPSKTRMNNLDSTKSHEDGLSGKSFHGPYQPNYGNQESIK
jgi:hypothetical protein